MWHPPEDPVSTFFEYDKEDSILINLKVNLLYLKVTPKAADLQVSSFGNLLAFYKFFKKYNIYLAVNTYSETLK